MEVLPAAVEVREPAAVAVAGGLASAGASEDQMDTVMREMYGSTWALGMSAHELSAAAADPRAYAAEARPGVGVGVGLGWGEGSLGGHARATHCVVAPAELAALRPDSTLRLVSSSTPRLEFY